MSDIQTRDLRRHYREQNNLDPVRGIVGDANGVVYDNYVPGSGRVWVRTYAANGSLSMPFLVNGPAINTSIDLYVGLNVLLERDPATKELYIARKDFKSIVAANVNPLADSKSQYTSQQSVVTMLVTPTSPVSKSVHVKAWRPIANNTAYTLVDQDVDLTSYIPAAGLQRYATILLKYDYSTIEVKASTSKTSIGPETMTDADIQENLDAATAGSSAIWSVWLHDNINTIGDIEVNKQGVDHRQFLNTLSAYKYTPSGTADTFGNTYDRAYDDSYFYVKTAAGWKRAALSTF